MKKSLLFSMALAFAAPAFAQPAAPVILPEFYSMKISKKGEVIVSASYETVDIYEVATGNISTFEYFYLGNGNCLTPDGKILVGTTDMDVPVMIKSGVSVDLSSLSDKYPMMTFNGITPDGGRIVGNVSNPVGGTELTQVPMYIDVAADGTFGEVNYLPFPEKDWTGRDPQYVAATYVSNDGNIILGQIRDYTGQCSYPIVYKMDNDGKWSYSLPSESMINPNHIPLPEDPGEFNIPLPQPQDYMTEAEFAAYQQALEDWSMSGYQTEYPEATSYMTPENATKFQEAEAAYNKAASEFNEKFRKFYDDLYLIIDESTFFLQNGFVMSEDGKFAVLNEEKIVELDEWTIETQYPTYTLDLTTGTWGKIKPMQDRYPIADQILSDGTVIANTPMPSYMSNTQIPPQCYVLMLVPTSISPSKSVWKLSHRQQPHGSRRIIRKRFLWV